MSAQVNDIWKHIETGNYYVVTGLKDVKHPVTGDWENGVEYEPLSHLRSTAYVRFARDFHSRFELVQPKVSVTGVDVYSILLQVLNQADAFKYAEIIEREYMKKYKNLTGAS